MSDRAVVDLTKRSQAACNLVCFPFAGAGPAIFRGWGATVPPWVGVWSVNLAGREGRFAQPPCSDLKLQVAELVEAVRPLCGISTVLYGHSLGAKLAAHVAQELFPGLDVPRSLIVAASRSPWSEERSAWDEIDFATVSEAGLVAAYQDIGGMDPGILGHPELLNILMPVIRADAQLAQAQPFIRESALSVPVYALYGRNDPIAGPRPLAEWHRITRGPFDVSEVTGGHLFLKTYPTFVQDFITPILLATVRRTRVPG
jgi:medium-chain acyl-[acyl-carrier-protein] hydrolase